MPSTPISPFDEPLAYAESSLEEEANLPIEPPTLAVQEDLPAQEPQEEPTPVNLTGEEDMAPGVEGMEELEVPDSPPVNLTGPGAFEELAMPVNLTGDGVAEDLAMPDSPPVNVTGDSVQELEMPTPVNLTGDEGVGDLPAPVNLTGGELFQSNLRLTPVGEDTDGEIKPIEELSLESSEPLPFNEAPDLPQEPTLGINPKPSHEEEVLPPPSVPPRQEGPQEGDTFGVRVLQPGPNLEESLTFPEITTQDGTTLDNGDPIYNPQEEHLEAPVAPPSPSSPLSHEDVFPELPPIEESLREMEKQFSLPVEGAGDFTPEELTQVQRDMAIKSMIERETMFQNYSDF